MSVFDRLLANLHPAINKDPLAQPSLQITSTNLVKIAIRDGVMQIAGQASYDLSSYTIASLAGTISGISGFTANAVAYGNLSALTLLDGLYTTNCIVNVFTNPVWHMLKPIALQFKAARTNGTQAVFQAKTDSAAGMWLDELGRKIYGVTREPGEPDQLYAVRVFDFSLASRLNNIAIAKILNDLGYPSTVTDTPPHAFNVNVTLPTVAPQGYVYSTAGLQDLVDKLRPAGVQATIVLDGTLQETTHIAEVLSYALVSESWTWDNFPGANGWVGFSW